MVITTVLADCPNCKKEVEAKFVNCDDCYEAYLERGGKSEQWDEVFCDHLVCTECEADLSP